MEAGELMEIYNEQMQRLETADLNLGWLEETRRTVRHEEVKAVEEIWHHEIVAEYENGGRDVIRVIDVPGIKAAPAWEERIPIRIYHPYTQEELEERQREAAKRPMEERMEQAEAAINTLRSAFETAAKQWTAFLEARGEG